jgi:hypothetical protein
MSKLTQINEGLTYDYLLHGLAVIVLGGILIFISGWFFLFGLIIGISLMCAKSGVEVDTESLRIRKFSSFPFFKSGNWISLENITQVDLILNFNQTKVGALQARPVIMSREDRTAKTFDLILINDLEDESTFNQFMSYSLAKKALETISKIDGIHINDRYAKKLAQSIKKRRS